MKRDDHAEPCASIIRIAPEGAPRAGPLPRARRRTGRGCASAPSPDYGSEVPEKPTQLLLAIGLVAETRCLPLGADKRDERAGGDALDQMILLQILCDRRLLGSRLGPILSVDTREIHQIVEPGQVPSSRMIRRCRRWG